MPRLVLTISRPAGKVATAIGSPDEKHGVADRGDAFAGGSQRRFGSRHRIFRSAGARCVGARVHQFRRKRLRSETERAAVGGVLSQRLDQESFHDPEHTGLHPRL